MTIKKSALAATIGAAMALTTFASQAEITVLKQDPQAGNPLSRLNFTVGGSIRPQFQNMTATTVKTATSVTALTAAPVSVSRLITTCLMTSAGSATTSWVSIFLRSLTGITTTPTAHTTPRVVCSTPV